MPIFLGIDPGLSGAVAQIHVPDTARAASTYRTWDAPIAKDGKHTILLPREMKLILLAATAGGPGDDCIIFIEKVHAIRQGSRASAFNFGDGYGLWKGLIAMAGWPYELVTPQRWQKEMLAGMQGGKDASCIRAQQLFPEADLKKGLRSKKLHDGRADALLIAEFGRRIHH